MAAVLKCFTFTLILHSFDCGQPIYQFNDQVVNQYELPSLPFDYHDLEPYIDTETVKVHHQGHHAAYTKKLNAALENWRQENSSVIIVTRMILFCKEYDGA